MTKMVSIRLPDEINQRLEALAARTGRSKTFYVKEAIQEHLEDLEDYYLAVQRLDKPGRRISMDELVKEIGLED